MRPHVSAVQVCDFAYKGRKGRWNRCICCHCAVIPSLLGNFTRLEVLPRLGKLLKP
jgi:hypothetical protein